MNEFFLKVRFSSWLVWHAAKMLIAEARERAALNELPGQIRLDRVTIPTSLVDTIPTGRRVVYQIYAYEWGGGRPVNGIISRHDDSHEAIGTRAVTFFRIMDGRIWEEFQTETLGCMLIPAGYTVITVPKEELVFSAAALPIK
jgi:hypothetical protein